MHWGNRPWWNHRHHDGWHRGHWRHDRWRRDVHHHHHHYYGYGWGRPWYRRPAVWGLTAWSLGNLIYNSGYCVYTNPYYVEPVVIGTTVIEYSTPVTMLAPAQTVPTVTEVAGSTAPSEVAFDRARQAFYTGDYVQALSQVEQALASAPTDAALHEFRALTLFAMGRYQEAAATLNAVLAVGPGWDWETMRGLYPSVEAYTLQLRALEGYVRENRDAAPARFVLAYHYLTCDHTEASVRQLQKVVELEPQDTVASELLSVLDPESAPTAQAAPAGGTPAGNAPAGNAPLLVPPAAGEEPGQPAAPARPKPPTAEQIVGEWTAKQGDDGTIQLQLEAAGTFTWTFTRDDDENVLKGTYTLADDVLVLTAEDGGQMVANVGLADETLGFRLVGSPPADPGLKFSK
ncbi:Tetratricopeptide repeat protein [Maioricimonas rarisocia]|uniref:Tetratricopeptide repeat protein n=1 Tax=Maioricimonas rarisocia TaxID=2528026 RepID=A0A517Z3J7_9PLAN|nr:tetratricopeptide repeat protein [Maioricimonas rarisocia]QDU37026.1 Tetratricopeptide repeat protein [Maioricimonas rarisocia]